MYDVVFKMLMEDKDNARCFVGTILGEQILDIEFAPQEFIHERKTDPDSGKPENLIETLKPRHLDFVTTIRTRGRGKKKVLIEIQQSLKPADVVRFRIYMGEEYQKSANVVQKGDKILKALPIAVIYVIGDETPKTSHISNVAYKITRSGSCLLTGEPINIHKPFDPLIEALTHDAFFVHVGRITDELFTAGYKCSDFLQMLSLFAQTNFVEENFLKYHNYPITNQYILNMRNTLEYIATDPVAKRLMQEQRLAEMDVASWKQTVSEQGSTIKRKESTITRQGNIITQQGNTIVVLQSNNEMLQSTIDAQAKQIEELKRLAGLN